MAKKFRVLSESRSTSPHQIRDADRQIKTSELRLLEVTKNIFSLIGFLDYSKRLNN